MSLILDALKKSEQERRRDKGPDLQTIHQPALLRATRRSYGHWWIIALVVANIAVLGYWWQQRGVVPATAALPATTPASAVAPIVRVPEPPAAAINSLPSTSSTTGAEYTRITPGSTPQPVAALTAARVEEVDELPEDVRNNLPAMTFSFHVYSSNPQQRTIIINNRRMREGEEVNAGLLLQEITEDGVILQYLQHRIHISVLAGW